MSIFSPSPPLPAPTVFRLSNVVATRENVVRLEFTATVYLSGLLDVRDGLDPAHYSVAPVAGTVGLDGEPVWPVAVVKVAESDARDFPAGSKGRFVDLVLDRSMTAYPARYAVSVAGIFTLDITTLDDWTPIDPSFSTATFDALAREMVQPQASPATKRTDIANAGSRFTYAFETSDPGNPLAFGSLTYENGDYAPDDGDVSLLKRVVRRLFSVPGSFAHLGPRYGLGIATYGKKLLTAGYQQRIRAEAVRQVQLEPEVLKATVTWSADKDHPSLVRMFLVIQTRAKTMKFDVPFRPSAL